MMVEAEDEDGDEDEAGAECLRSVKRVPILIFACTAIGIIAIAAGCTGTATATGAAAEGESSAISVTPSTVEIYLRDVFPAPAESPITITNEGETGITVNLYSNCSALNFPSEVTLNAGESRAITISASEYAAEGTYTLEINAGETVKKTVTIQVIHCASITVSPSSCVLDFGDVHSSVRKVSREITLREVYGLKTVSGITITQISGENHWVKPSPESAISVSKSAPAHITFTLTPGAPDYHRASNRYTWKFMVNCAATGECVEPATIIITVKARIMRPPRLAVAEIPRTKELKLKFDKPRGTVPNYQRDIYIPVKNEGDEPMTVGVSIYPVTTSSGVFHIQIDTPRRIVVTGRSTEELKLHITVPYDTPEGTYRWNLHIEAEGEGGRAGRADVSISVVIIWPVDFNISSSSPYFSAHPPSIDFGSLELREHGYEHRALNLTLTEYYRYKPVRDLRFSTRDEYGNWLEERHDFFVIPPGESRNITIKIAPGLEAVPRLYSWSYYISAREITPKQLRIRAKIVPLNIPLMLQQLNAFRGSQLYRSYPSSGDIISNGAALLENVEQREIGVEDWRKIPVLIKATLSLLSALNEGIISSANRDYDRAVESLLTASVSSSTISSNSVLNDDTISEYACAIAADADGTAREVLSDEAKKLELRAWAIKKALEHASDDVDVLKDDENVLESALCYQHAATLYGLLDEREKRLECIYEKSKMIDWHDELVGSATDLRIRGESIVSDSRDRDLVRLWGADTYLLLNPYNYDTFTTSYETAAGYLEMAAQRYRLAGELLLYHNTLAELDGLDAEMRRIISIFFLSCLFYASLFLYLATRILRGTMAYLNDTYEQEMGDILVERYG